MTRTFSGDLLDVARAAELLGTTPKGLRARIARRTLPYKRFGSRIVFSRLELDQFIADLPGVSLTEARANLLMRHGER